MVHIEDVLVHATAQAGDQYLANAFVHLDDSDPAAFDCSGLVAWSCGRAGVAPAIPRSSWQQAQHCRNHGREIAVDDALVIRGALLFKFGEHDPFIATIRPPEAHVAWSLGNGTTMEAASSIWGVGVFSADRVKRRWTHAGLVPGVEYSVREEVVDATSTTGGEEMTRIAYFRGPAGDAHPYVVAGVVGKHLSADALRLYNQFGTPVVGSPEEPLASAWLDGVALLDGPLRNVEPV